MRALSGDAETSDDSSADSRIEGLMAVHGDALYNFARTVTRDGDAAADCTQHAFVRAYEQLRKGRPVNRAWLYTTTRNAALDWLRQQRRIVSDNAVLQEVEMPPTGSSDRLLALSVALDRLPAEDREVLYLFSVDRFRAAEIGEMLGSSADAVRMRLYRARERLRRFYGEGQ